MSWGPEGCAGGACDPGIYAETLLGCFLTVLESISCQNQSGRLLKSVSRPTPACSVTLATIVRPTGSRTATAAGVLYGRDGHVADSEKSQNYKCLDHFLNGKECSDGAGNRRNRKISSRRFSSLVFFFSQLKKFATLELRKVGHFVKK